MGTEPLAFFDAIFVLNLPERRERLAATRRELKRIDASAEARLEVAAGVRSFDAHGFPSPGAYGCFLGHLSILRQAQASGCQHVLILEDDVSFDPERWRKLWPAVQKTLESCEWDLVNLGFEEAAVVAPERADAVLVPTSEPMMLAHCYAVHQRTLGALITFLEAMLERQPGDPAGGPMHYDGALFHYTRDVPGVLRWRPVQSLAGQRSSRSDIADGRWFDRGSPLLRALVEKVRSIKNRLRLFS